MVFGLAPSSGGYSYSGGHEDEVGAKVYRKDWMDSGYLWLELSHKGTMLVKNTRIE